LIRSASSRSETAVYPDRSANRTVALRRSSGGGSSPAGAGGAEPAAPVSDAPHEVQKRAPGGFCVPQLGQAAESEDPQDMQKRAPSGFVVPQLGQSTASG
jgi:hypothetical protein